MDKSALCCSLLCKLLVGLLDTDFLELHSKSATRDKYRLISTLLNCIMAVLLSVPQMLFNLMSAWLSIIWKAKTWSFAAIVQRWDATVKGRERAQTFDISLDSCGVHDAALPEYTYVNYEPAWVRRYGDVLIGGRGGDECIAVYQTAVSVSFLGSNNLRCEAPWGCILCDQRQMTPMQRLFKLEEK